MKGPRLGDRVAVSSRSDSIFASVRYAGRDHVELQPVEGTSGRRVRGADDATLLYGLREGIVEVQGAVRGVGLRSRLFRFDYRGDGEFRRRQYVRVAAEVPLVLRRARASNELVVSKTIDLSGGGMGIVDPVDLPLNAILRIEVRLPGEPEPLAFIGRLVRHIGDNAKGVEIEKIAGEDRRRLLDFIFMRRWVELRRQTGAA